METYDKSLFDGIMFTYTMFHKMVFSSLKGTGLTAGQPKILEYLAFHSPSIQRDIAAACEIEPSTTARILARMETAGLIKRQRDAENRRAVEVFLTDCGKRKAAYVQDAFLTCERKAFSGIQEEDRRQFLTVLEFVETNLRSRASSYEALLSQKSDGSLHQALMSSQALLYKELFMRLKDTGLTPGQPKILEFLEKKEGCQQKEIASGCRIEPATVTTLLLYMEKKELIERRTETEDRRAQNVYLTEKGRHGMERTLEALEHTIAAAFKGIAEQQEPFKKTLRQLQENLKKSMEGYHD